MLKAGVSILSSEFCLIEGLEAYLVGGTVLVLSSSGRRNLIPGIFILISGLNLLDRKLGSMII